MSSSHRSETSRRGAFFQFSVRTFLWLFTAAIVMAWVGRQAMRGSEILIAIAGLLLLAVGFMALCMLCFLIGWLPAFVSQRMSLQSGGDGKVEEPVEPPQLPPRPPSIVRRAASSTTPVQE